MQLSNVLRIRSRATVGGIHRSKTHCKIVFMVRFVYVNMSTFGIVFMAWCDASVGFLQRSHILHEHLQPSLYHNHLGSRRKSECPTPYLYTKSEIVRMRKICTGAWLMERSSGERGYTVLVSGIISSMAVRLPCKNTQRFLCVLFIQIPIRETRFLS